MIDFINWLFTPLFNTNFVNCFGNDCYAEPFGLLPPPISLIIGGVFMAWIVKNMVGKRKLSLLDA